MYTMQLKMEMNCPKMVAGLKLVEKKGEPSKRNPNKPEDWRYEINLADNLFLIYHRLIPKMLDREKNSKAKFLEAVSARNLELKDGDQGGARCLSAFRDRQARMLADLEADGWKTASFELTTDWRQVVGLGGESVLDTSLAFHPLHGFPYIPGSSVKGIARAAAEQSGASRSQLLGLFGSADKFKDEPENNQVGGVCFFDALPARTPMLEVDVMTPHYGEYYQSEEGTVAPADWLTPTPVPFLTVAAGEPFHFFLGGKGADLINLGKRFLEEGLMFLGAGAKTNAGYGYFADPQTPSPDSKAGKQTAGARTIPAGAVEAEIVDVNSKPAKIKLSDGGEIAPMGGINPGGLGLRNGSTIYVTLNRDRKTKRIQSATYAGKP